MHSFFFVLHLGGKESLDRVGKQNEVEVNKGRGNGEDDSSIFCLKSSEAALSYLSLVILCVEEVCVPGQLYHRSDVVLGLVDDGQVEQPVETERGEKTCYNARTQHNQSFKTKGRFSTRKQ